MSKIDPRTYFMSDYITLSDLVGCDSVYRYGIPNPVYESDTPKLQEGHHLAEVVERHTQNSGFSITYGYISPGLSRSIVRYQSPDKPSYHRWDFGAAMDLILYDLDMFSPRNTSGCVMPWDRTDWYKQVRMQPIRQLRRLYNQGMRWSRAITYAESQIFCIATRRSESPEHARMATYENRWRPGLRKPHHIKHSPNSLTEMTNDEEPGWRGKGWPSYHGGGRRQYEHIPTGLMNVLSDFLYDAILVDKGGANRPPIGKRNYDRFIYNVMAASLFYEKLVYELGRLPIIAAYVNPAARHTQIDRSFDSHWVLDIAVPPESQSIDPDRVAGYADDELIKEFKINSGLNLVRFTGLPPSELDSGRKGILDRRFRAEKALFKRGLGGHNV